MSPDKFEICLIFLKKFGFMPHLLDCYRLPEFAKSGAYLQIKISNLR